MRTIRIAAIAGLALAGPCGAQTIDHSMHGMAMPAEPATPATGQTPQAQPPASVPAPDPHAGHDMSAMPGMAAEPASAMPGNAPAPAPGRAADRYWGAAAMAAADARLRREHGGMTYRQILFNLAEYQVLDGGDGYRWDGEAWIGGDIDRLAIKSEGSGEIGRAVAAAELQALYSRAIDPYWNLQAGIRHDFAPHPSRSYATIGIEGLAPYWFDVEAALFLSDRGDVLGRAEAWYDQRVTRYLLLQPRIEANFAAQDIAENGIGAGVSNLEAGLRLRYEKSREFAPYVGVSLDRKLGETARLARRGGQGAGGLSLVAGVRAWF